MSQKEKVKKRIRKKQVWKLATIVLFALLMLSMFTGGLKDFFKNPSIGTDKAGEEAMSFINTNILQGRGTAEIKSVSEEGNLYKLEMEIDGQRFDSYITKDGKYLFPQGINLEDEPETVTPELSNEQPKDTGSTVAATCGNTPKSAKPAVEMFIMSHCPYGTQIEKGMLPVAELLKDKIDFKLRFVYYAMHGETEVLEQLNQHCIQETQPEKLLNYLKCFLEAGDGESCLKSIGVDTAKMDTCVADTDKEFKVIENLNDQSTWLSGRFPLFDVDKELNENYGVGGSPTLIINGQSVSSGRDSASLLNAICCAFDEKPAECEEAISSAAPSPGFGFGTTGASSGGGCGA